jgi:hypothetical protein
MSYQIIPILVDEKCTRPLQLRVEEFYLFLLFCLFLFVVFFLSRLPCFFLPPVITPNLLPSLIPDDDWTFCACLALAHVGIFSFCPRVD